MRAKDKSGFDAKALLAAVGQGRTHHDYRRNQPVDAQGDRADAVFFVQRGKVKLTVPSRQGKQAVIALLGPGTSSARVAWPASRCAWRRPPP